MLRVPRDRSCARSAPAIPGPLSFLIGLSLGLRSLSLWTLFLLERLASVGRSGSSREFQAF